MLVSIVSWHMQMQLHLEIIALNSSCLEAAKRFSGLNRKFWAIYL